MSEQDNLQNADGNEDTNPIENTSAEENTTETTAEEETTQNTETEASDDELINEIDESNAEDAEDEGNVERHTIEEKDYHSMSLDALVIELEKLVKNEKVQAIKKHVDNIKNEFTEKFNALLDDKKADFLSKGGNEIDFHYSSPLQRSFKDSYKEYRSKISAHYKNLETNLKDNLGNRLSIIDKIKELTESEGTMNTKYKEFKELQESWKSAGPIPRDKYNNAWNSYHFNVERFYDLLHLDRDLRDKDFAHNLEKKTKIIERAEDLVKEENTKKKRLPKLLKIIEVGKTK